MLRPTFFFFPSFRYVGQIYRVCFPNICLNQDKNAAWQSSAPLTPLSTLSIYPLCPSKHIKLTYDGCVVGLLPETELLQLFNQVFIHLTNHQWFTLEENYDQCPTVSQES